MPSLTYSSFRNFRGLKILQAILQCQPQMTTVLLSVSANLFSGYFMQIEPYRVHTVLPQRLSSKESACDAGDTSFVPEWGRSPGGGHSNPFQYSCLENPVDGGAWQPQSTGL